MPNPAILSSMLTAGLKATFFRTYDVEYKAELALLADVMDTDLPSDTLTEEYGYMEAAPHPRYVPDGQPTPKESFGSVGFTCTNRKFELSIPWRKFDRLFAKDDVLRRAKMGGTNFAQLDERILTQYLTAAADPLLMPSVPNAPDGSALFATSRFGIAAGNIYTGTGTSVTQLTSDLINAVAQAGQYQDGKGQPLLSSRMIDAGVIIMYPLGMAENMTKMLRQITIDGGANAGVSNVIRDAQFKITPWPTSRLTGSDWFLFFKGAPVKAFFSQKATPGLETHIWTADNSQAAQESGEECINFELVKGVGIQLPVGVMQVNN